jgi:AcrR family transcriptional regulator
MPIPEPPRLEPPRLEPPRLEPPRLEPPEKVVRVSRRSDEDNDVERAVLEALERVLADVSVHQLSVERILREAGTSRATFYRNFNSKWSVIAAALERAVIELFESADSFLDPPATEDPVDVLNQSMTDIVEVYKRHRRVFRAAMQYWHTIPELRGLWLHFLDQQIAALTAFIEQQRALGRAVAGPPADELARVLVWTAVHSFIAAAATDDEDPDAELRVVPSVAHVWGLAIYGRAQSSGAAPPAPG